MADNFNPNNLMGGFQQPTQGGYYQPNEEQGMIGSVLQGQITSVMRSFKDELSFNMQSLNLTLSNLTNSMNNLSGKIGELGPNTAGRYIDSGINSGTFLGYQSREFANYQPLNHTTFLGGIINSDYARHPFNVSPLEYYSGLDIKRGTYGAGFLGDVASSVVNKIPGILEMGAMAMPFLPGAFGAVASLAAYPMHLIANGLRQGGGVYTDTGRALRRMSGRFSSSPFTNVESLSAARQLQELAYSEIQSSTHDSLRLGYQGYKDVALLGLQGDLFHGSNTNELMEQVQKSANVVKQLTGIMGLKSVKEAMEAIVQMKNMGINPATMDQFLDYTKQLGRNSFGYGFMNSMSSKQMLQTGMQIAQSGYGTYGIPSAIGINSGMQSLAYVNEMRKRGLLTDADIAVGGGATSMASRMLGVQAQVLNSGLGNAWAAIALQSGNANLGTSILQNRGISGLYNTGIGSMLNGDVFFNMANADINKHNLLAKLQSGQIDQATGSMLMSMFRMNPIFNNRSAKEQEVLAASMVKNWFGTDAASSKAIVSQIMHPEARQSLNFQQHLYADAAEATQNRYQNSFSGMFYGITNAFEKITSKFEQIFTRMSEGWTDYMSGMRTSFLDMSKLNADDYIRSTGRFDKQGKYIKGTASWDTIKDDFLNNINGYDINKANGYFNLGARQVLSTQLGIGNPFGVAWDAARELAPIFGSKRTTQLAMNELMARGMINRKLSPYMDIVRESESSMSANNLRNIFSNILGKDNIDNSLNLIGEYENIRGSGFNNPLDFTFRFLKQTGLLGQVADKFHNTNAIYTKKDVENAQRELREVAGVKRLSDIAGIDSAMSFILSGNGDVGDAANTYILANAAQTLRGYELKNVNNEGIQFARILSTKEGRNFIQNLLQDKQLRRFMSYKGGYGGDMFTDIVGSGTGWGLKGVDTVTDPNAWRLNKSLFRRIRANGTINTSSEQGRYFVGKSRTLQDILGKDKNGKPVSLDLKNNAQQRDLIARNVLSLLTGEDGTDFTEDQVAEISSLLGSGKFTLEKDTSIEDLADQLTKGFNTAMGINASAALARGGLLFGKASGFDSEKTAKLFNKYISINSDMTLSREGRGRASRMFAYENDMVTTAALENANMSLDDYKMAKDFVARLGKEGQDKIAHAGIGKERREILRDYLLNITDEKTLKKYGLTVDDILTNKGKNTNEFTTKFSGAIERLNSAINQANFGTMEQVLNEHSEVGLNAAQKQDKHAAGMIKSASDLALVPVESTKGSSYALQTIIVEDPKTEGKENTISLQKALQEKREQWRTRQIGIIEDNWNNRANNAANTQNSSWI